MTVTCTGTSGHTFVVVLVLNSLQGFIKLMPNGPRAWPVFGEGFAAAAGKINRRRRPPRPAQ